MSAQPPPSPAGAQSPLSLTGPLTVGDLLDRAFRLYRARFGLFLLTAAVLIVPLAILSGIFLGSFFGNYMRTLELLMRESPGPDFDPSTFMLDIFGEFGGYFVGVVLFSLLSAAITAIVHLSLIGQSVEALHGGSLSLIGGIRRGLRRFWAYVGLMIVQWAAILAATVALLLPLILVVIALAAGGVLFGGDLLGSGAAGGIIAAVGMVGLVFCGYIVAFILVLIPTLYLAARWLVAPAALIAEGTGPIESLRRSWHLSRGNVLRMVGYLILLNILLYLLIYLPATVLQTIMVVILQADSFELIMGFSAAFSSLFSIVSIPFYIGAVVLLYYDLRIRKESYDLELRVADLEEQVAQGAIEDGAPHA